MSEKKILTIGFELAGGPEHSHFDATVSLLDWDIVLFKPIIDDLCRYADTYQGKLSLSDTSSFRLKECCEHWRREVKQATETGKTVIVFLPALKEVFVDTGERSYSGTGRNRRTTRHVSLYTNYQAMPVNLGPVNASGSSMKLVDKGAEVLAPFWAEFENRMKYEVLLTESKVPACFTTRSGAKPVGAIYRSTASSGSLLLLPDIEFYDDKFFQEKDGKQYWSSAGKQFSAKFVSAIVALDKALRSSSEVTPEPPWASDAKYALAQEQNLRVQLLEAERKVEQAQREKEQVAEKLSLAGRYRDLLYEKGKPLEFVIIEALRVIGFVAAQFKESDSEFDVVFESSEGRLIGEAEGKDNKAVNIDKLRQLSMNIHEDLQREEVSVPAKPVLFGNGYRLQPLSERPNPFTDKCHSAAATSSTALVHTPDMFPIVQYLLDQKNEDFARQCRNALLSALGRVHFPQIPNQETAGIETQVEEAVK